eukprot:8359882-Pyramimonas_sp.AAC.1
MLLAPLAHGASRAGAGLGPRVAGHAAKALQRRGGLEKSRTGRVMRPPTGPQGWASLASKGLSRRMA